MPAAGNGGALDLTGADAADQVRPDLDKFYAIPPSGLAADPMPLSQLSFLDDRADQPVHEPITGIDRFTRSKAAFYRPRFCEAITDGSKSPESIKNELTQRFEIDDQSCADEIRDFVDSLIAAGFVEQT